MTIKGGKRPGAGRKSKALRSDSGNIRDALILQAPALIAKAIQLALAGDAKMIIWCCDHVLGKAASSGELELLLEKTLLVKAQREEIQLRLKPPEIAQGGITLIPMRGQLTDEERARAANELEPRT